MDLFVVYFRMFTSFKFTKMLVTTRIPTLIYTKKNFQPLESTCQLVKGHFEPLKVFSKFSYFSFLYINNPILALEVSIFFPHSSVGNFYFGCYCCCCWPMTYFTMMLLVFPNCMHLHKKKNHEQGMCKLNIHMTLEESE